MSKPIDQISMLETAWGQSRSGGWAGRGFHYQHLLATLILLKQWAGLLPIGSIVPEGLEDCVLELEREQVWIQAKSRRAGTFSQAEIIPIFASMKGRAKGLVGQTVVRFAVALERPCRSVQNKMVDEISSGPEETVVVCSEPWDEILANLTNRLSVPTIIAEGLASDLYLMVAEASQANAGLPYRDRRRISVTDCERRIWKRLEAEDPSAINEALFSGAIQPVDFTSELNDSGFYLGVRAQPGHLAAGLILDRPTEVAEVTKGLRNRGRVLLAGPSGAGKSALMWLAANAMAGQARWHQVGVAAGVASATAILRFIRSRKPNPGSPIGLVFDDISANTDLWNLIISDLRGVSNVFLLGSIRHEDLSLVADRSDITVISVSLSQELARSVWEKLFDRNLTKWPHWIEAFEQSDGLMLEYVHLLTQGKRLEALIEEQVKQRRDQGRNDELALIRVVAALSALGAEVDVAKLVPILGLTKEAAHRSLARLLNEHLILESRPGVLGGLHPLRSKALSRAAHDEAVFLSSDSLWTGLGAATAETLPHLVHRMVIGAPADVAVIRKFADVLIKDGSFEIWIGVLTGLGLATLDRQVEAFVSQLEMHDLSRNLWSFAAIFQDPGIEIPDLSNFDQWSKLVKAVMAFRALPQSDLRSECLANFETGWKLPEFADLKQANRLLSCFVPTGNAQAPEIPMLPIVGKGRDYKVSEIAELLSTAHAVRRDLAIGLAEQFGSEEERFALFSSQIPWVTDPVIETLNGERTVRANLYFVAEEFQPSLNDRVVEVCDILAGISPLSDAAASDAINAAGEPVSFAGHNACSKKIPRKGLPAKSRVAWNVAFRQLVIIKATAISLSDYTEAMADLVRRAERILRQFTEQWIRGKNAIIADATASEVNQIVAESSRLAYAGPQTPPYDMTRPSAIATDDMLGSLLSGALTNLFRRLVKLPIEEKPRSLAMFADSLVKQAEEQRASEIWRSCRSPPTESLISMAERLADLAAILHELAHDPDHLRKLVAAKPGGIGSRIRAAAFHSRRAADQRLDAKLRGVEGDLAAVGMKAQCVKRQGGKDGAGCWPPAEIAIVVELGDTENDGDWLERALSIGGNHLGNEWPYTIVPACGGRPVLALAMRLLLGTPWHDPNFGKEWAALLPGSIQSSEALEAFDQGIDACTIISAVVACGLDRLEKKEHAACLSAAMDKFKRNSESLTALAEQPETNFAVVGVEFLLKSWREVAAEFASAKDSSKVENPLCLKMHRAFGGGSEPFLEELAQVRVALIQGELINLCSKPLD